MERKFGRVGRYSGSSWRSGTNLLSLLCVFLQPQLTPQEPGLAENIYTASGSKMEGARVLRIVLYKLLVGVPESRGLGGGTGCEEEVG